MNRILSLAAAATISARAQPRPSTGPNVRVVSPGVVAVALPSSVVAIRGTATRPVKNRRAPSVSVSSFAEWSDDDDQRAGGTATPILSASAGDVLAAVVRQPRTAGASGQPPLALVMAQAVRAVVSVAPPASER